MTDPLDLDAMERVARDIERLDACAGYCAHFGTPRAHDPTRWNREFANDLRALLSLSRRTQEAERERRQAGKNAAIMVLAAQAALQAAQARTQEAERERDEVSELLDEYQTPTHDEDNWASNPGPAFSLARRASIEVEHWKDLAKRADARANANETDLQAAQARIRVLEERLRPFADAWDRTLGGSSADDCSDNDLFDCVDPSDFREARAALNAKRR